MARIIANVMITPDGTVLQSYHRHDYKTHKDANGEEYMIDGGNDYVRTSVNREPAQYITIEENHPHTLKREWFAWGTYGKQGNEPLTWKHLKDMDTSHIEAILATCSPPEYLVHLFRDELQWRKSHEILDTVVQLSQEQGDYS